MTTRIKQKIDRVFTVLMYTGGAFIGAGLIAHIDATGMPGVNPLIVVLFGLLGTLMFGASIYGFWNLEPPRGDSA